MDGKSLRFALAAHASLVLAPCALSQVLEIQPGGDIIVFEGPATRLGDQARPIARPAAVSPHFRRTPVETTSTYLTDAGARQSLSPQLLEAVAYVESRFNNDAVSPAGAIGAMQLMPGTAAELGVDPKDPAQNIHGGASYLRQMIELFDGDLTLALAAYNAGPEAVRRYGAVPPFKETKAYVEAVLSYMADAASGENGQ